MKLERTKNSERNIIFGIINRILAYVVPFATRTLLIYVLGTEYLGLNSLFSSVIQLLSLSEMGLSAAVVHSMYKPLAEDDFEQINRLLNYFRKLYYIIGIVIMILGIAIIPFIPYLIKDKTTPDGLNLTIVYLIYLVNTSCSYFLFGYKRAVFTAYQREDIDNNISSILHLVIYPMQIAVLLITRNYYFFIIYTPVMTIIQNITCSVVVAKRFPHIKPNGYLNKNEKKMLADKTKYLFLQRFGNTISGSFDSIIVSSVLGLNMLAIYSNYYYVCSVIIGFMAIAYSGILAGVGNSIVTENIEKNKLLFNRLDFMNGWVVVFCTTSLVCLYQPFMYIWVGPNNMLSISSVICFSVFFYLLSSRKIVLVFKDATGLWKPDRFRPIIAGMVNLVINIVLARLIGVNGVIISTILSYLLIEIPWESKVFFEHIFIESPRKYYYQHLKYTVFAIFITGVTYVCCHLINKNNLISFIAQIGVCLVVPNAIFYLIFRKEPEMKYIKGRIAKLIKKGQNTYEGNKGE